MDRTHVMVLFGGESPEHEVSISSARNVYAALDDAKYDITLAYIDTSGKWWLLDRLDTDISTHGVPQLLPALGDGGFVTIPESKVIHPNVILPILHGINGEDGSIQGLAQLLHIPIVGCGVAASAIGLDKTLTKKLVKAANIPVVPYEVHYKSERVPEYHEVTMRLGSPVFVKPARGGSSVGVSKVYTEEEFIEALNLAHSDDDAVLIEQAINGRELEVAVLGSLPSHRVSGVGEIISQADFYSYDDKYTNGTSRADIPASIPQATAHRIQALAGRVYEVLGCAGLSRVDFFLTEDDEVYLNEINTMPGFTNISMYPKLWKHEGMTYAELVENLIDDALTRDKMKEENTEV